MNWFKKDQQIFVNNEKIDQAIAMLKDLGAREPGAATDLTQVYDMIKNVHQRCDAQDQKIIMLQKSVEQYAAQVTNQQRVIDLLSKSQIEQDKTLNHLAFRR